MQLVQPCYVNDNVTALSIRSAYFMDKNMQLGLEKDHGLVKIIFSHEIFCG